MWAEMKKHTSHKVGIIILDEIIDEAQCECGAGQGPSAHCKHVGAMLFGMIYFSQTKQLIIEQTCTQTLQAFNRVKPNKGCLVKAISMPSGLHSHFGRDPCPQQGQHRAGYQKEIRNKVVNFHATDTRAAVTQPCGFPNMYGLKEYDYYSNMEDRCQSEMNLSDSTITKGKSL